MPNRAAFVLERRGPKRPRDPWEPYGAFMEEEPDGELRRVPVATLLLTNRECPFRCVFCDLWKDTLDETVPAGAIAAQIRGALARLPRADWIKLYNAGSFFDPRAIPPGEIPAVAALLEPFERVIVESHPRFVDERVLALRELLRGRLEVAIGLETADAAVLARLEKGMTLEDFERAAAFLRSEGIDVRAFVLVQPPYVLPEDAVGDALRSIAFAEECGAGVCSLLPTRGGNGALEALAEEGRFAPPSLATLEEALDRGLSRGGRMRIFADLWGLESLERCPRCSAARRERLGRMNLAQRIEPRVACACSTSRS